MTIMRQRTLAICRDIFLGAGLLIASGSVYALHFEPSDKVSVDFDTTLTYGSMWRVEEQNEEMLRPPTPISTWAVGADTPNDRNYIKSVLLFNSDDGNRNFEKGDQVSNRYAAISDFDVRYKNIGAFVRGRAFYDSVYYEETAWDGEGWDDWQGDTNCTDWGGPNQVNCGYNGPEAINNSVAAGEVSDPAHFSDRIKDLHGSNVEFLDAYVYGAFPIGEHSLDLRIGRQAITWGEAIMLQGGISFGMNRIDAAAATSPGVELKEIFLPTEAVYGQIDLTPKITLEAYWQYEWRPSTLMAAGSYFSSQDMLDTGVLISNANMRNDCALSLGVYIEPAGKNLKCFPPANPSFVANIDDTNAMVLSNEITPDNPQDQFGVAFRFLLDNGSEAGVYFIRYHDHYPSLWAGNHNGVLGITDTGPSGTNTFEDTSYAEGFNLTKYTIEYKEGIELIGLTYNTVIEDVQMGFELTYRENQPIVPACSMEDIQNSVIPLDGDGKAIIAEIQTDCKDPSMPYWAYKNYGVQPDASIGWSSPAIDEQLLGWPTQTEVFTYNMGVTLVVPPTPLWDTGIFVGEFGGWVVGGGYENEDLKMTHIGVGFTQEGNGVSALFLPQYKNVLEGVDLTIPFFVNYTLDGSFAYYNFSEEALWFSVGAEAIYLSKVNVGLTYSAFGGANSTWRDRDNIAFNVKYTF